MVSKTCNQFIYGMNNTEGKQSLHKKVQNNIEGTYHEAKNALGTLSSLGKKVSKFVSEVIGEAKRIEDKNLGEKGFRVIPTCIENVLGKHCLIEICGEEQIDNTSESSAIVHEIGQQILEQAVRKDLDYQILVKKDDEDVNAYVIPGGKIILTSGLLKEIQSKSDSIESFRKKVAGTLAYLVAKSSRSDEMKQVEVGGLFSMISKVVSSIFKFFFISKSTASLEKAKVKLPPGLKKKQAIGKVIKHSINLSGKVLLEHQKNSSQKEARELALKFAAGAGFKMGEEELDNILEIAFNGDEGEAFDEEVQEEVGKIIPQLTKLFA